MECRRILLVDDNPHDAELTLTALDESEQGQEVTVVPSGQAAVAYLRAASKEDTGRLPDLILLDLNMPHMNGLEVLDAIRAETATRDIPVVMLTTSGEERDIRASYAHGASAYVVKPMDLSQFRDAMSTIKMFWMNLNRRPDLNS